MDINYNTNKYKRTYIGGSKKKEQDEFIKAAGVKDDLSDFDWIQYRRLLIEYSKDLISIIFSWKRIFKNLSLYVSIISLIFIPYNIKITLYIITVSVIFQLIYLILNYIGKKKIFDFLFHLNITETEIKKRTNFELKH